jgi:autotransporter-associated beta strand protein
MRIANIRSHLRAALEYSALALAVAAGLWSGSAQAQVTRTYTNGQTIATPYSTSAPNDPTTLTIASGSAVQSGILSGSGAVIKSGAGQVKLSAVNTYSGGTTINAGTLFLDVQQDAALGTGPVTLNSGGTLYLERINATNALTVNGGRIHADNGFGDSWGGPVTLNADMVIDSPGYATLTFKSTIGGTGGITLTGQPASPPAPWNANIRMRSAAAH